MRHNLREQNTSANVTQTGSIQTKSKKLLLSTTAVMACALLVPANANADNSWDYDAVLDGNVSKDVSVDDITDITVDGGNGFVEGNADILEGHTVNVEGVNGASTFAYRDNRDNIESTLSGNLNSNIQIVIIDKDGLFFTDSANIDVQGLIATSADVAVADIMDGGTLVLDNVGNGGAIVIDGSVTVAEAGLAAFVSPFVTNHGIINAKLGNVVLAAGETVTLDMYGDGLVEVAVEGELADALLANHNEIRAEGGYVQITAKAAKGTLDNVVNNTGLITVTSVEVDAGGKIILSGGDHGTVRNSGTVETSSGGEVNISGERFVQGPELVFLDAIEIEEPPIPGVKPTINSGGGNINIDTDGNVEIYDGEINAEGGDIDIDNDGVFYSSEANTLKTEGEGTISLNQNKEDDIPFLPEEGLQVAIVLPIGPSASIQNAIDAIDNTGTGDNTINVSAGTYNESVNVDHANLALNGANAGTNGAAPRDPETVIMPNSPGFLVTSDNVTIDGFAIVGAGSDAGVEVDTANNVTVSNNTMTGFEYGVLADAADDLAVIGNVVDGASIHGMLIKDSDDLVVAANTVTNSALDGIRVEGGKRGHILYNDVHDSGDDGVDVDLNESVKVSNNVISGTQLSVLSTDGNAIEVSRSKNAEIYENQLSDTGADGVDLKSSLDATVRNNTVTDAGDDGIDVDGVLRVEIYENTVENAGGEGFEVTEANRGYIHDNTVDGAADDGIDVKLSDDIRVEDNNITETGSDGIQLVDSERATIDGNFIGLTVDNGIYVNNALEATISWNDIGNTGTNGIYVSDSDYVDILLNTINNTGEHGIKVNPSDFVDIHENTIHRAGHDGINVFGGTGADIRDNRIRYAENDGIHVENFGEAWIAYNDIKWTGDDGVEATDGEFVSIYNNYIDLSGYLPSEGFGNIEVGQDADGIHVENVGGGELPLLSEAEGFGYGTYGASVEIYNNDVANSEDDGIQVEGHDDEVCSIETASLDIDGDYSAYIADNIVGHVGDDGIDVDDVDVTFVKRNAVTLAGDKGITIDGGRYAGVFDNRVLLTGDDGIQVENVYGGLDIKVLGDDDYGYGWAVNVSGNEVAMTGDEGIEIRYSGPTKVAHNSVFMAGFGEDFGDVVDTINSFANETFIPFLIVAPQIEDYYNGFEWNWGNGHGIYVHGVEDAYYSPNGWAADIRGNTVKYTGGHGIYARDNDRTRIQNNTVRYAGIDYTSFHGAHNMLELLNSGPFHSKGRRDLWMSTEGSMMAVLDGYFGRDEEPEEEGPYITIRNVGFDSYDGIHAENIYGQSREGLSGNSYLFDLEIRGNDVRITGDDGIEVDGAGRTLIARNTIRDSGHGDNEDYGSGDYYGADGIHVRNVTADIYDGPVQLAGLDEGDYEEGFDYESPENYALIIRNNDIRRTADDGIEVVGSERRKPPPPRLAGIGEGPYGYYGFTDRVLIAENTVRRTGDNAEVDSYYDSDIGQDGYGHDGIHVRGIQGDRFDGPIWNEFAGENVSGGSGSGDEGHHGFYGYAVDIIDNDVRRTGDDGIEVINSASTLIYGNTVRNVGLGGGHFGNSDYYGADGIHVRNVGGFFDGPIWNANLAGSGESGIGFQPYSVAIVDNDVRRTRDDGIEVVGEGFFDIRAGLNEVWEGPIYGNGTGRTLIAGNTVRASGILDDYGYYGGTGNDGYGHDGIHVRGVYNNFLFGPGYAGGESEGGYYGYAVDVLDNDVRRTADDGIEVINSESTLIADNTVRRAGQLFRDYGYEGKDEYDDYGYGYDGADYYGADGIHVRNVGGYGGPIWDGPGISGDEGFEPYSVVIVNNRVRSTADDGIEVILGGGKFKEVPAFSEYNDGPYNDYGFGNRVLIAHNKVKDADDDGIVVTGSQFFIPTLQTATLDIEGPYPPYFGGSNVIISDNKVKNSGGNGIHTSNIDDLEITDNKVSDSYWHGAYVAGGQNGYVLFQGNTFTDNGQYSESAQARFESGDIDMSDLERPNTFINTTGIPATAMQFDDVYGMFPEEESDFRSAAYYYPYGGTGLRIVNETLGSTVFDGYEPEGSFYVRFEDGSILDPVTGDPIVIDGTDASFDGVVPGTFPGELLPISTLQFIEDRLYDADDETVDGRGQIFVGFPDLGIDNLQDFLRQFGTQDDPSNSAIVTINGLPSVGGGLNNLNNITPAAGGGEGSEFADIDPAAGGDEGQEVTCMADAVSSLESGPVTYNFGGTFEDGIASESACVSTKI